MAFHESHERPCPHCGERMSATAPKCLNCGRYVDEEDEAEAEASGRTRMGWFVAVGAVAVVIVLVLVLVVR